MAGVKVLTADGYCLQPPDLALGSTLNSQPLLCYFDHLTVAALTQKPVEILIRAVFRH